MMQCTRGLKRIPPLLLLGVLASGASPRKPAPAIDCGTRIEGMERLLQPGALVLLGELHGTKEIPRLMGDLVCQAAGRGVGVSVLLELSAENDPSFEAWLSSAGQEQDRQRLFSTREWRSPYPDGRTSVAMFEMLDRLRVFRRLGWRVRVFGASVDPRHESRDESMALGVRRVREEAPQDLILVLAGNNHTRVDVRESMGGHLRTWGLTMTSLNVTASRGTLWTCRGPTCGEESVELNVPDGKPRLDLTPKALHAKANDGVLSWEHPAFHGSLFIGRITASPPAGTRADPGTPARGSEATR
ncbi:hypothetical protein [Cystobacter ferrugineus]|uniref:Haem-binding uptake Tiki superfamily ChaN domain-containing protein n=1 Tax=Cystobacter ferrugineus TaxID=83449 RepID=A0A1L9B8L0_9BACT|nr:hypothetical protein [Cystobacter ferrugineus]OJH38596.1 hypothetical protein BON30_20355 [Cystobacter ferrugineus]